MTIEQGAAASLLLACATGKHITHGDAHRPQGRRASQLEYLKFEFDRRPRQRRTQIGRHPGGEDLPVENVSLELREDRRRRTRRRSETGSRRIAGVRSAGTISGEHQGLTANHRFADARLASSFRADDWTRRSRRWAPRCGTTRPTPNAARFCSSSSASPASTIAPRNNSACLARSGRDAEMGALLYHARAPRRATPAGHVREADLSRVRRRASSAARSMANRSRRSPTRIRASAPRLEVFAAGQYMWLPFEQIAIACESKRRKRLRDLLWAPAIVRPRRAASRDSRWVRRCCRRSRRSPGRNADGALRLGRVTEWRAVGRRRPGAGRPEDAARRR